MKCIVVIALVGLVCFGNALPEPPVQNNQGWGQQEQQPQNQGWQQPQLQQNAGWGQQSPPQDAGWGQQPPPQEATGWAQQQPQEAAGWQQPQQAAGWQQPQQASGWGQGGGAGGGKGGKAGKGLDWEYNFALGYQGEKGGHGKGGGGGWGAANSGGDGGWSSEPETNIKKPNFGEFFRTILSIPRELKNLLKESGLWILFVPLLVIIPLFLFAFSAGKFFGGMDEGYGWDKRSTGSKKWWEAEWETLKGFIKDPKVQRSAKGFMDEFVAQRIVSSIREIKPVQETNEVQSAKVTKRR